MRLYNQVYQKIGIDYAIVNSIDGYDEDFKHRRFPRFLQNDYEKDFLSIGSRDLE